ncbi:MAG: SDR family oxidoreductase [Candidatus Thermoplasmatota archaeon]|nr:SDR family oxidoreductase [Candidatus Thermoplasmatota archaeon]MBS3789578.1 SDR family oxidoreductase [Candidatus Thermoplasmatota archaeon]
MDHDALSEKIAIVTGASSGIGEAVCKSLARKKVNLALVARNEEKLEALSKSLEEKYLIDTLILPTDVRKEEQVKGAVEKTIDKFGKLNILINNAGIIRYGEIENFSTEDYKDIMGTNCDGMFFFTREAIPHLKESEGNLVFIGSFDANHPRSFNPIYAASKWWTKAFAHSIESIVGESGVGVSLINPSEVRTDIEDEEGEKYKKKFDSKEVLDPEEVAKAVLFVISQEGSTTVSEMNIFRRDKMSDFF